MEIRCNRLTGSCNAVQDAIDALPPEGGTVFFNLRKKAGPSPPIPCGGLGGAQRNA